MTQKVRSAVVRFCGDSGDGMQLSGSQFTRTTGIAGNDLFTFPDFPAEIRAPAGTLAGVSGFQIHFSENDIFTQGDAVDVLIAMNPAALKANLKDLKPKGILITNSNEFDERNLTKAKYETNPLENGEYKERYKMVPVAMTDLTRTALEDLGLAPSAMDRCKNFFALGLAYWIYQRDLTASMQFLQDKFASKPILFEANKRALTAGYHFGETCEILPEVFEIEKAHLEPGTYRNITGNSALAIGLVAGAELAKLPLYLGSYPITPASDILHELSKYKHYNVKTFQAEDEIAAICSMIGASFGGALAVTTSSGPGISLKSEAMNLAVMTELPLVVVDVQRAGPSTGMPTKTEQADLLQVLYGRNGESPIPVISTSKPSDCFDVAVEAVRIALKYMTPVMLLSDGSIANGSEPWKLPEIENLPGISHRRPMDIDKESFQVYKRNDDLARLWPVPGMAGFEHRIGGIEKDALTGNISYDPVNHDTMVRTRAAKIAGIAKDIPDQEVYGETSGDLLILGWGSTFGSIRSAVEIARKEGQKVSHAHLRHLNPFPKNLETLLKSFKKVVVPELNLGQLHFVLQGKFAIPLISYQKVQGKPFQIEEISNKIKELL